MAMTQCPKCGHSIPADSTFCPDCGFNLIENEPPRASRLVKDEGVRLRRAKQPTDSWQRRLIPNLTHLKQVGQFVVNNGWFLLAIYVISLVFNEWRWEIFGLFILTSYLFSLLTGKESFWQSKK
ncbi:zinc-ribbon domain-containing protein [Secundilactobacillus hailunensis]|uniref:Zinc-ribbon domain-containing protein n=1 Tax=Secundilactobacillus hailunensis TaxID=2559923 RepID=A0ABW1T7Q0_9LACO|nr:zinc ribbon domain-containing protein [Secundilactobacillus hailunensis]